MTTEQQPSSLTSAIPPTTTNFKLWAMLCHLSSLVGFIVPFANVLAPFIIWLVNKEKSPIINDQGKESLNFQITMTVYFSILFYLLVTLMSLHTVPVPLMLFLFTLGIVVIASALFVLIAVVTAGIKAGQGKGFHYPLTIRFIH